jgi:hypothetical protein
MALTESIKRWVFQNIQKEINDIQYMARVVNALVLVVIAILIYLIVSSKN